MSADEPLRPPSQLTLSAEDNDISRDGIDRRGFLKCMAWAGTGPGMDLCGRRAGSRGLWTAIPARSGRISASSRSATATSVSISRRIRMSLQRCRRPGQNRCRAANAGLPDSHGRPDASSKPAEFDALSQQCGRESDRCSMYRASTILQSTTARCISTATAKAQRQRLVQLRSQRRPLHRAGECRSARRYGQAGPDPTGLAEEGSRGAEEQRADCSLRAYSAVGRVSGPGAGEPRTASRRLRC